MPKSLLKTVIADQRMEMKRPKKVIDRELLQRIPTKLENKALIIKGLRRVGKSTMLKLFVQSKFKDRFYYLNFDDERLFDFKVEDFQLMMECFIETMENCRTLFLDEIQNVVGWESFVNRMLRSDYTVYITGSNANLLSKELGTHLMGRHLDFELFPFSFREFLLASKVEIPETDSFDTGTIAKMTVSFEEYFRSGGMPEIVLSKNTEILSSLISDNI